CVTKYVRCLRIEFLCCFRSTDDFKLMDRFLKNLPCLYVEHPRKCRGMDPIACDGGMSLLLVISHAHPADHYSAAAIIQHGLRSIEIESSVEFVKCTMYKTPFFCIKTAGEISC